MKLASYHHNGRASWGVVTDDARIIDVRPRLPRFHTLLDVLRADALDEVRETIVDVRPDFKVSEVELLPPVVAPEKILCIGVNYANRNEEYKDSSELPKYPSMFFRTPGSFVGHGQNLIRPPESEQLDYEGEIVLVIGKECHRIAPAQAAEHIAGYTLCNEGTIRDWLRHAKFNVTQGKNFDRSGSIGPWMVTADEIEYGRPMHLTTRVNGEIRQDDTTANLIFDFGASAFLHHHLHHAEAGRHDRFRHADRRGRALRSAEMAEARRRDRGDGAGNRHPEERRGGRLMTSSMRPFERSLPMQLMLAREAVMQRFRPHLNARGLTDQQWRIVRALNEVDRPRNRRSRARLLPACGEPFAHSAEARTGWPDRAEEQQERSASRDRLAHREGPTAVRRGGAGIGGDLFGAGARDRAGTDGSDLLAA